MNKKAIRLKRDTIMSSVSKQRGPISITVNEGAEVLYWRERKAIGWFHWVEKRVGRYVFKAFSYTEPLHS